MQSGFRENTHTEILRWTTEHTGLTDTEGEKNHTTVSASEILNSEMSIIDDTLISQRNYTLTCIISFSLSPITFPSVLKVTSELLFQQLLFND